MKNKITIEGTVLKDPIPYGPPNDPCVHFPLEFEFPSGQGGIKVVAKKRNCPANVTAGSKLSVTGRLEKPKFLGKDGTIISAYQIQASKIELQAEVTELKE